MNKVQIIKKSIIILFCMFMITTCFQLNSYSASTFDTSKFKPDSTSSVEKASKLQSIGNTIIGVVQVIGSCVSVGVLIVIGIRYMAGSVEEKAEYKNTMLPYLVGAILVFAITNILPIAINIAGLI